MLAVPKGTGGIGEVATSRRQALRPQAVEHLFEALLLEMGETVVVVGREISTGEMGLEA